jgi:hypothetical protein
MPISNRLASRHCSTSDGLSSRTALYGPVRRVVWQGSVGDRRPYADLTGNPDLMSSSLTIQDLRAESPYIRLKTSNQSGSFKEPTTP